MGPMDRHYVEDTPRDASDLWPLCEWFALCDHPAVGTIDHPALGAVPVCRRCIDRLDMGDDVRPYLEGSTDAP